MTFKLISLNTAGRSARARSVASALMERRPELLALQEVTATTAPLYREVLGSQGYFVDDSLRLADSARTPRGPRRYGVLTASKWKLRGACSDVGPWPERFLSVTVRGPFGHVAVHNLHAPAGSVHGFVKVEALEAVFERLGRWHERPQILCGDFNSPQAETPAGDLITWAFRERANGTWALRRSRGERWDSAERNLLLGLSNYGLDDTFRALHGYGVDERSWETTQSKRGRRFDHVFASRALGAVECRYLHGFRLEGLSDHSAIETVFVPAVAAAA
jgi:exonuclease III